MVAVAKRDTRIATILSSAAEAGMPRDQAERFLKAGYVVLEQSMSFHAAARDADRPDGPDEIALGGTRGSAKSRTVFSQIALDDCQRVHNLKFLWLRKIMKTAAETLDDLVRDALRYVPHTFTETGVEFPNTGSRILIGGYKDARDIEKYLGVEYDGVAIEEATMFTEDRKDHIYGSIRSNKPNWRPRKYLTTNADGAGLAWFKKKFVIPWRAGREESTRFFQVSYRGNPFLDAGYVKWLEGLKGQLAKAWRDCDWDAFAGMAFPEFSYERHVVPISLIFDIPEKWIKWRALDWGYASPFANGWLTKNPDTKRIYVYREIKQAGLTVRQQAQIINDMTLPEEIIRVHYADPSLWARKDRQGEVYSTADEFKDNGILLTKGDNNRLAGKRKINTLLADLPDGKPGLMFFENCPATIDEISNAPSDPLNPEDVDTEAEDHCIDMLKYGLTNERRVEAPRAPAQANPINNPKYRKVL